MNSISSRLWNTLQRTLGYSNQSEASHAAEPKKSENNLVKNIEKFVEWGKKKVGNWGKWLKGLAAPRVVVDDKLKDFKTHIAKLDEKRDQHHWTLVKSESLLRKFANQYTIDGVEDFAPKDFLQAVKPTVINFLLTLKNIKMETVLRCNMSKTDVATGETLIQFTHFKSYTEIVFQETDREELYQKCVDKMMESLAKFTREGSGWAVDSIAGLDLNTAEYKPLKGSSYIKLSPDLAKKKAIVNMKNEDNECFKWCVTRALNPVNKNQERISMILKKQAKKLKWDKIVFPMEVKNIHRFEKLNPVISVNVLSYEGSLVPLRVSNVESSKIHIDLLLIAEGEKKHYCLIKSMSRLVSSQLSTEGHKKFICRRCLNYFGSQELLDEHTELCREHEAVREKMPPSGTSLFFKNHHKKIDLPFVIYADFESMIKPLHSVQPNPKECYTEKKQKHIPVSFCYYVKCSFDDRYSKLGEYTAKTEDEDVAQIFVNMLEEEAKAIYKNHPPKKMIFTDSDAKIFKKATCCWICEGEFNDEDEEYKKVRDHCHYTGKFRGAAHNKCNLLARRPKFTPVLFHNLANYDAHLFVRNLGVSEGNIDCIPNNEEKYISFTKSVVVDKFIKEELKLMTKEELKEVAKSLSLSKFSKLKKEELLNLIKENSPEFNGKKTVEKVVDVKRELRFIDSNKFMPGKLDDLVKNLAKEGESFFQNTGKYYHGEKLKLLMRKGIYPYEWMDFICKLDETAPPPKSAFYSTLNGEEISDEEYEHVLKVWKTFEMKKFRDYHNLYNRSDVLLLADVFENFRKVCKENYDLDPCWYYTAPGLSWDACLKLTKIKLELLSDINMLHMFEKGIRGGISMIPTRHSKANNKYMGEKFDPSQPSKFITYLDANNLYGWAMSKNLPTGGFEWVDEKDFGGWKNFPCILEVDLLPIEKDLHDYFNHYPLAPENLLVNKVKKLLCTLNEKKKYVIHHETLKLYMSLGMKIGKIHRIIRFNESPWMKKYIDLNTELRTKADNDFEKDFFQTHEQFCIRKNLMYDFHYNYIKTKYGDRAKLLMTDTDSLCYEIQTEDFYKDIKDDVNRLLDTSNFPKDHPSDLRAGVNKKVIGMFKDEAGGKIIEEFVGLRAKLYSYKMFDDGEEKKKCKGVRQCVVKRTIRFDNYKRCLFGGGKQHRIMNTLRSRKHDIFTEEINKVALSANDDKRIILPNIVDTYAAGHHQSDDVE
ncbi:hypothetical protein AWC38_SpisGene24613 [Stylophora pistillata]|uniref:Rho termination factor-like N-terminal domain-containing protein n=1 Tax=Stylophora pistillata TaxID=50429 RepID=A0A2B4R516_STYPI|nr:hypothetical protein AWC38_SpisGene24613 [Stylophora pistillata]